MTDRPLNVSDLIRALSKLPPDAVLWQYEPHASYPLRTSHFSEGGPIFVQYPNQEYEAYGDPVSVSEIRVCFEYDSGQNGEPLSFE